MTELSNINRYRKALQKLVNYKRYETFHTSPIFQKNKKSHLLNNNDNNNLYIFVNIMFQ